MRTPRRTIVSMVSMIALAFYSMPAPWTPSALAVPVPVGQLPDRVIFGLQVKAEMLQEVMPRIWRQKCQGPASHKIVALTEKSARIAPFSTCSDGRRTLLRFCLSVPAHVTIDASPLTSSRTSSLGREARILAPVASLVFDPPNETCPDGVTYRLVEAAGPIVLAREAWHVVLLPIAWSPPNETISRSDRSSEPGGRAVFTSHDQGHDQAHD